MTRADTLRTSQIDLTACEREPIHIPGSIQPHGVLLVLEGPTFLVRQVSRNVREVLGLELEETLGQPVDRVLGDA